MDRKLLAGLFYAFSCSKGGIIKKSARAEISAPIFGVEAGLNCEN